MMSLPDSSSFFGNDLPISLCNYSGSDDFIWHFVYRRNDFILFLIYSWNVAFVSFFIYRRNSYYVIVYTYNGKYDPDAHGSNNSINSNHSSTRTLFPIYRFYPANSFPDTAWFHDCGNSNWNTYRREFIVLLRDGKLILLCLFNQATFKYETICGDACKAWSDLKNYVKSDTFLTSVVIPLQVKHIQTLNNYNICLFVLMRQFLLHGLTSPYLMESLLGNVNTLCWSLCLHI